PGAHIKNKSWLLSTVLAIVIVAAMLFFYRKAHDQTSGSETAAPLQQPAGSSLQVSAEAQSSVPRPAGSSLEQPAAPLRQPAGIGAIKIANLKTRTVQVYDQNSKASSFTDVGYAGSITPTTTTLQVPAGTYKLKFGDYGGVFVEHVAVSSARSSEILLGTI